MSASNVSSTDTLYAVKIDTVSTSLAYIGEAAASAQDSAAIWRIRKLETVGNVLNVSWADGDTQFDNVWTDRSTLIYL